VIFQEATIDIKLPRRSLLVQFTCNACGERTKRLINRVAYERGSIFLQVNFVPCLYLCANANSKPTALLILDRCMRQAHIHTTDVFLHMLYICVLTYMHKQCAGCQVYHKFVDNLGLVVEYDLREENELQGENAVNTNSED
jgi:protein import protein ZIM17